MGKNERKPLGTILVRQNAISQLELERALREQTTSPDPSSPLASRLIARGVVSEADALRALSEQHGVPGLDLAHVGGVANVADLLPRELADAHRALVVQADDARLFVAMASPSDRDVLFDLELATGRRVFPYVALASALPGAIAAAYASAAREAPPDAASLLPGARGIVADDALAQVAGTAELRVFDVGGEGADEISAIRPRADASPTAEGAILIVDDEEEIRRLLARVFADVGHRVLEADRPSAALRAIRDESPALLVLDALLPDTHGYALARRLRASERYGGLPVLMISGVHRARAHAAHARGIDAYIEKPFRIADVLDAATRLLEARRPATYDDARGVEAEASFVEGLACLRRGAIDDAITRLAAAVDADPLAHRFVAALGVAYGLAGRVHAAIDELERAVELHPNHFDTLANLAVLHARAGYRHRAVRMWERAADVAPNASTRAQIRARLATLG